MSFKAKAIGAIVGVSMVGGYMFSQRSLNNLAEVKPQLQAVAACALEKSPVDFVVIDGGRTAAEHQNNLLKGVSWIKRSKHQDGLAIDVAAYVEGKITYELTPYFSIAGAFYVCGDELKTPITWGGEWKKKDLMHFELKGGY